MVELQLWTEREAAQRIGRTQRTLRAWRRSGRGPAFIAMPGRRIAYEPKLVAAWVEARITEAGHRVEGDAR